ncbi:MAG: hypothetical protein RR382_00885 [Tannerellaceae bacterium]
MELVFPTTFTSSDGTPMFLGHETDNTLVEYFMSANRLKNKSVMPPGGNYDDLVFVSEPGRITANPVKDFGIKSFPHVGAFGFYTPLYHPTSIVVIPINRKGEEREAPGVTITDTGTTIHVEIVGDYTCYRIAVRLDAFATEFITYATSFDFTPMYTGDCIITVTGHSNEISVTSKSFETTMALTDRT